MEQRLFSSREQKTFEQICMLKQSGVLSMMRQFLLRKYGSENVIFHPTYLIAKGNIPVALIAHADTVFTTPPTEFFYDKQKNVMWSPNGMGADDRAGIFAITKIVSSGLRPHVIITTDEESGCIGASKMVCVHKDHPFDSLKFMIQLDRRGMKDSVYYDCANEEFEKFITQFGFETAWGTLSDISVIAPYWGVAAVNFSVGYVEEHSKQERLYVGALFDTIQKVENILEYVQSNSDCPTFEYVEDKYARYPDCWGYYDDGYSLAPVKAHCVFCGQADTSENLLTVHWGDTSDSAFDICTNCYSSMYEDIEWCCDCKEAYILSDEEKASFKDYNDRMTWKCKKCKEGSSANGYEESTASSGESDCGVPAGSSEGKHGAPLKSVGSRKRRVHKTNAYPYL